MAGEDLIRYDLLVQDALKGVVRRILSDAAKDGLAGDHHFYISFRTDFPGARLSNRLREKYPQEMTIVLQHQFWDLGVTEHTFEVGLSFNGVPERLLIPFEALTGFFDPSVQFGLKFTSDDPEDEGSNAGSAASLAPVRTTRGAGSEPTELQPKKSPAQVASKVPAMPKDPPAETAGTSDLTDHAKTAASSKDKLVKGKPAEDRPEDDAAPAAQIVSLDAFRKKN